MQTPNVLFKVALSDGSNIYEGKGDYQRLDGQPSPWQRLQSFLALNKLEIRGLSLYTKDGRTFNLDSAGKNPKFMAFWNDPHPKAYNFFRRAAADYNPTTYQKIDGSNEMCAVIEAVYENTTVQLWVNDANYNNCWVNVIYNDKKN